MDVVIKDVPEDCVKLVQEAAMIAVESFIRNRDLQVPIEKLEKAHSDVDLIRASNGMKLKYQKVEGQTK